MADRRRGALRGRIGGSAVWRVQRDELLRAEAQTTHTDPDPDRPRQRGCPRPDGAFLMLRFPATDLPRIDYSS
ncbi:hypothetical protein OH799_03070 [Nocardia sp. NBC_00881]|uniref:hypothetical protein n=1 Tax=Nocardia sp. NBC_00881 TaxID=2975995 RepID=UPI0038666FEF|nr:hypothetical protein OH799_03070 [Nocardia sp. NBC_00881]